MEEDEVKKDLGENAQDDDETKLSEKAGFWQRYQEFRKRLERDNVELDPDEIWADVRDQSPGGVFEW
jgi:hypothetical protein